MNKIIKINCPKCKQILWVDTETEQIIKEDKAEKIKKNFDDLLMKEKEKKEKVNERFRSIAELEKEKKKRAEEIFNKNLKK